MTQRNSRREKYTMARSDSDRGKYTMARSDSDRKKHTMTRKQRKNAKRLRHPGLYDFLDWIKAIVIAVLVALFLNFFIIVNATVPSGSMEDTIMVGSRMIGFRLSYIFSNPERGDIIIFKYPDDESEKFVKRIIGLPGETVMILDGTVYIDGIEYAEDYLKEAPYAEDFGPYEVPEDCYFVMGDNRNNSNDARYWTNTYVSKKEILGKAIFTYWPLNNIKLLK